MRRSAVVPESGVGTLTDMMARVEIGQASLKPYRRATGANSAGGVVSRASCFLVQSNLFIAFVASLCALSACGHVAAPSRVAFVPSGRASEAFRQLSSSRGPERFAQMTPMLYRGAQPTATELAALRDLGVKSIVSFVDDPAVVRAEVAAATPLGLDVHNYPFSGLEAPDPALLRRIIDSMRELKGPLYIHCRLGRDRTSLVAALYRVWVQGWDPVVAWRHEARAFGHRGLYSLFFRKLDRTYWTVTKKSTIALR